MYGSTKLYLHVNFSFHGFSIWKTVRQLRSCYHALRMGEISYQLRKPADVILLDFSEAYDGPTDCRLL